MSLESQVQDISDRLDAIQNDGLVPFDQFPPFEIPEGVPLAAAFEKITETQKLGTTIVSLRWVRPLDANISRFEIWAKNVAFSNQEPFKVTDATSSPATVTVTATATTAVVLFLKTIMKNGLESPLSKCPTVSTNITTAGQIGTSDIADNAITNAKMADASIGTAEIINLSVTNAKINDLAATKITAGTLVAGVIYSGTINAVQINAGTLNSVNVNAGTYSLISGLNTMTINSLGFRQSHSSGAIVSLIDGAVTISRGTRFITLAASSSASISASLLLQGTGGDTIDLRATDTGSPHIRINGVQVVGERGSTVSDPAGGGTVDTEARTAIVAIIDRLQAHGLIA